MKNVKKGKRKKSDKPQFGLISKILLTINILVVVLYLTACYIGYVDPDSASYLALMPMAYPLFLVATIPTLLFWVVKHRRLMLITVCSWLATIPQICTFMPIHFNDIEQAQSEKGSYTLTTYNTLGFAGDKETKNAIIDEILEKNADFVCIQEGVQSDLQTAFGVLDDCVNIVSKAHFSLPRKVHLPLRGPAAVIITAYNVVDISNNFKI